ncbi:MAG: hypothetical protein ACI8T1_000614 [Verrucomicrobiales bacterium]|jgi:hypothetical protein
MADSSSHGNDLQSEGADPNYEAAGGFSGGAYLFDGSQRLTAPVDISGGPLAQAAMGAWIRTDALPYTVLELHKVIIEAFLDGGAGGVAPIDPPSDPPVVEGFTENGLLFTLPAGTPLNVDYSQDIINWDVIGNDVNATFQETDAARNARPSGYYRLVQP